MRSFLSYTYNLSIDLVFFPCHSDECKSLLIRIVLPHFSSKRVDAPVPARFLAGFRLALPVPHSLRITVIMHFTQKGGTLIRP